MRNNDSAARVADDDYLGGIDDIAASLGDDDDSPNEIGLASHMAETVDAEVSFDDPDDDYDDDESWDSETHSGSRRKKVFISLTLAGVVAAMVGGGYLLTQESAPIMQTVNHLVGSSTLDAPRDRNTYDTGSAADDTPAESDSVSALSNQPVSSLFPGSDVGVGEPLAEDLSISITEPDYSTMSDAELEAFAARTERGSQGGISIDGSGSLVIESDVGNADVRLNGYRDQVAAALLANYPSRSEMRSAIAAGIREGGQAQAVKQLNDRLTTIENSIAVLSRAMANQDIASVSSRVSDLQESARNSDKEITLIANTVSRLAEVVNAMNGYETPRRPRVATYSDSGRVSPDTVEQPAVQGQPVAPQSSVVSMNRPASAAPKPIEPVSDWYVRATTNMQAFLASRTSTKTMRVVVGSPVRGCGTVTAIQASPSSVTTEQCGVLTPQ